MCKICFKKGPPYCICTYPQLSPFNMLYNTQNMFRILYVLLCMFNHVQTSKIKHTHTGHTCKCLLMHIHTQSSTIRTHHSSTLIHHSSTHTYGYTRTLPTSTAYTFRHMRAYAYLYAYRYNTNNLISSTRTDIEIY